MQIAAEIIAVANLAFAGMGSDHRDPAIVEQLSSEKARLAHRRSTRSVLIGREDLLDLTPKPLFDDRRMIGVVRTPSMIDAPDVGRVRKDAVEMTSAERPTTERAASGRTARRRANACVLQLLGKQPNISELGISTEDSADEGRVLLDDRETATIPSVSDRRRPAHPHPASFRLRNLVADAFSGDLALELRERQQHV